MRFGLIHYTEDWRVEGSIELDTAPELGSIIIPYDDYSEDFDDKMYFVDKIMYSRECNYIFVRPYTDYGKNLSVYTPNEERLMHAVNTLNTELEQLKAQIKEQHENFYKLINGVCNDIAEINSSNNVQQENMEKIIEYLNSYD